MIAHGYSLNTSTVEQLESKSYLQSTTMTTWATAIERRGCVFQYVFGPIFSCTPTLIYWLQVS